MKIKNNNPLFNDFEILLRDYGHINIFGLKIKSIEAFMMLRISLGVCAFFIFSAAGIIFAKSFILYGLAVSIIIYFLPLEIVKGKIKKQSSSVLAGLPDVIDIMASLINAGLTLDESIAYIAEKLRNPVSILFKQYRLKIFEGSTKKEAFDLICRMSFCTEFKSFIKIIHQSDSVGNPVKEILKDLAKVYRNNQRDYLKMKAERLESNLIIIIFIFIFIPMLIIFLIPVIGQLKILI